MERLSKAILLTGSDEQNNSLLASASNCISYITADFSTEQLIQDTPVYCRDNIELSLTVYYNIIITEI